MKDLINNRWIIKELDKEKYYRVKDEVGAHRKFLTEKLGYRLIVNPYLIKLEKLPGKAEAFMGIQEFTAPIEYGILCIVLMFLEDKSHEEQFILSQLTEYVQVQYTPERLDWTVYGYRKNLIKVIRYCLNNHLIRATDGDEESFARDAQSEVLFEVTGISKYFVVRFSRDIMEYESPVDFERSEWIDVEEDRGLVRRQRIYRQLLLSLGMYRQGDDDEDFSYVRNYRNILEKDMSEMFNCDLHIHKSSAYLVAREDAHMGRAFPENNNRSDIVLTLCGFIGEDTRAGLLAIAQDETLDITAGALLEYMKRCKDVYGRYWSKTYREADIKELAEEVLEYMTQLGFAERSTGNYDETNIRLRPIVGKIAGIYPPEQSGGTDAKQ